MENGLVEREHLQPLESSKSWLHVVIKMSPLNREQINSQSYHFNVGQDWTIWTQRSCYHALLPPCWWFLQQIECTRTTLCITTWQVLGVRFIFPALQDIMFCLEVGLLHLTGWFSIRCMCEKTGVSLKKTICSFRLRLYFLWFSLISLKRT